MKTPNSIGGDRMLIKYLDPVGFFKHYLRKKLEQFLTEFSKKSEVKVWTNHPFFGYFTSEQWEKKQYKHLDHHLSLFNI